MSFRQFAFNNVKRNSRAYFAYFISSAFMVMIFFTYAVFIYHPRMEQIPIGKLARAGMQAAEYVILLFAFFFIFYSISMFLKVRNMELGILFILGATPAQVNRLIFFENMLIGFASILTGIAGGLLLSKLFLLFSTKMTEMKELPFYWPTKALLLTVASFSTLFICISLFTLVFVQKIKVFELLQGNKAPKKEPRASVFMSFTGTVMLAVGLVSLRMETLTPSKIFVAAAAGIAGTYLFYSQFSVYMVRLLKRSRKALWRGTNLLWISEIAYKIKDNARILFMITVVTSIACMSSSLVLAMAQANYQSYINNPFALNYYSLQNEYSEGDLKEINRHLNAAGVTYNQIKVTTQRIKVKTSVHSVDQNKDSIVEVIAASNINELSAFMNILPNKRLDNEGSFLIYNSNGSALADKRPPYAITLESGQTLSINDIYKNEAIASLGFRDTNLLVVSRDEYEELKDKRRESIIYVYYVPEWNDQSPKSESPEALISIDLEKWFQERIGQHQTANFFSTRMGSYLNAERGTSLFNFIGIFIALIFSISSASFLYFKLHTELLADSKMVLTLSKIGLSTAEMKTSATLQIGLLFFVPIVISTIQTLVVLRPILETMYINTLYTPVLIASSLFLGVQSVFFLIVRSRYLRRLDKAMV
ncbi:putative ABC transport system permease protein [Paenibacillus tianmuensis]|uniref:Putative ABC transport system permease protein n=1 Tax=Paenibacillus tianmuensis TaxID=624147 RepID=A0A1G4S2Q7_9BACL|nr:ABC transporter permease [Paenibacillus tianmuensis]SCW63444.1 putative ABC transport system permease protein [Paenibacillus tianmuensis]